MTTPKATKYRIRRTSTPAPAKAPTAPPAAPSEPPAHVQPANSTEMPFATPHDDGFGPGLFPTAQAPAPETTTAPDGLAAEVEAVRADGLTGRQLRLARRLAQKNGIEASSDFEAVALLRRKGIDPFERGSILSVVRGAKEEKGSRALARVEKAAAVPQTAQPGQFSPGDYLSPDQSAREIIAIQRDIARRRRRKLTLLAVRLAFFVFLPTLIAGWYYFAVATPLYATKSEFVIQKADGMGGSGLGGLFSGTQLATAQDSITVQSYLQSRQAMLRLDEDQGFKAHFQEDRIDPLKRLPTDATNEEAFKLYRDMVQIGYDPSEGIVRMEVIAADPEVSRSFSESLISYAEEQVDNLTQRLRGDQMQGARENYDDAEAKVFAAQAKVLHLQEQVGILDPVSETSSVMGQVSGFETQLQQKKLELGQLLDNPRPNEARVAGVRGDIQRLEQLIAELRAQLTSSTGPAGESLASVTGQLRLAEAELETRQMLLAAAAEQVESSRIEANKQVRYLEMGVSPIAPDEPTYPRAFENTLLAFLIFSGIYLMLSLTASILREQVAS